MIHIGIADGMSIARVWARRYPRNGHAVGDADMDDMQAMNFPVIAAGETHDDVAGTSCACPTASGIFSLLNDARLAANKSSLGFLNPLIYKVIWLRQSTSLIH